MLRLSLAAFALSLAASATVNAQTCPNSPNNLTNGTSADANQVMANFNSIITCANTKLAPLASPSLTGTLSVSAPAAGAESLNVNGTAVIGGVTERLSLNSGSIGFNRRVATGQIYNTGGYAFQIQHYLSTNPDLDYLQFQTYTPVGAGAPTALVLDAMGRVAINNGTTNTALTFFVNGFAGGNNNWINTSDERLKKNVTQISGAIGIVQRLRGVRYNWRTVRERVVGASMSLPDNTPQLGFIAQEVEKVLPEAVVKPGKAEGSVYGLSQESIIPVLVEAIKEQQAEIARLRSDLNALNAAKR